MTGCLWTVRLAGAAEADFSQIVRWTALRFGPLQARTYAATLSAALQALAAGPSVVGVKIRPEIGVAIHTLHVARNGRKSRHFIVFRVADGQVIDVLRLLHDGMDLQKHLSAEDAAEA